MPDNTEDIATYYNQESERESSRLERHQLERDLTWRCLERYLPAGGRLLEIGAAAGGYTVELARRGYTVTAVDFSPGLLALCQARLEAAGLAGRVQLVQADARDLSPAPQGEFDAVLLMGPLYHLVDEADRRQALREAAARLRPGGVLFSAWISRLGILGDLLANLPAWIEDPDEVQSLLQHGRRPEAAPRGGFRGYFARPEEIAPLHQALGFETLALAGVEPAISADDESYNRLQGEQRRRWLDLLESVSQEAALLGASRHLLYIGRKP